jgi:hypothetical protein
MLILLIILKLLEFLVMLFSFLHYPVALRMIMVTHTIQNYFMLVEC